MARIEHELQLAERLGLLLDFVAEADREALRHLDLGQPRLHRGDAFAQRRFDFGVDALNALLVLPLDLHRALLARGDHDVLGRQHHALRAC